MFRLRQVASVTSRVRIDNTRGAGAFARNPSQPDEGRALLRNITALKTVSLCVSELPGTLRTN
jgi:hypothetical protein